MFTEEQIAKAKECRSVEELSALARENGVELTREQAENFFAQMSSSEISDELLDNVAGGGRELQDMSSSTAFR